MLPALKVIKKKLCAIPEVRIVRESRAQHRLEKIVKNYLHQQATYLRIIMFTYVWHWQNANRILHRNQGGIG